MVVVHVCDMGGEPLPSVLGPDTDKLPAPVVAGSLSDKVQNFHAASKLLASLLNITVSLPLVVS